MRLIKFFALLFVALFVIECFYPLGELVYEWFGLFGVYVGYISAIGGALCLSLWVATATGYLGEDNK